MVGTVPIRWDGQAHGRLRLREEGVFTVFEGECEDPGTLVRLWVHGEKSKGYLGLMEPAEGKLRIVRRLSPLAVAELPPVILYASPEGAEAPPEDAKPARKTPSRSMPEAPRERDTDLLWYDLGDGSLYTFYGGQGYRAIPAAERGIGQSGMLEKRRIAGRDYAVYPLRNGRMVL